jgi:hypothetical protein
MSDDSEDCDILILQQYKNSSLFLPQQSNSGSSLDEVRDSSTGRTEGQGGKFGEWYPANGTAVYCPHAARTVRCTIAIERDAEARDSMANRFDNGVQLARDAGF